MGNIYTQKSLPVEINVDGKILFIHFILNLASSAFVFLAVATLFNMVW